MKNFHALLLLFCLPGALSAQQANARARARDLGLAPGRLAPGARNAITDVAGVRVGHTTVIEGDSIRTGITAILPHDETRFSPASPQRSSSATATASWSGAPRSTNWESSRPRFS